jgi:hypothetical protein
MRTADAAHEPLVNRIRAEYVEMPGLALTRLQMQRLCQLDARDCDELVDALVAAGFLRCRPNQTYVRHVGGV